ncbi:MAG: DUF2764 family protein [Candidatus Omnitrophota bacterium]
MPAYYTYLISSLPMLSFGARPPFSAQDFLRRCQGLIPDREVRIIETVLNGGETVIEDAPVLKKWYQFDTSLRNELVMVRASHKKIEPQKYLRGGHAEDAYLANVATLAARNPLILEAEKILDLNRWQAIEDFVKGHYFDLEVLFAYALELSILLRWEKISTQDKIAALEEVTKVA